MSIARVPAIQMPVYRLEQSSRTFPKDGSVLFAVWARSSSKSSKGAKTNYLQYNYLRGIGLSGLTIA